MADVYGSGPSPAWLGIDWSAHLDWHEVEGRPVNVLDVGEGPVLLFLHGHSACWQHWLEQIPAFMGDHRVVAVDLPGFGHSPMPEDEIGMQNYARIVDGLMAAMDLDAACVVGSSMGGFIGAELARAYPQRVERLVLVGAAGVSAKYIGLPTEFIRHPSAVAGGRVLFGLGGVPRPMATALARRPRGRRTALGFVVADAEALHPALCYELIRGAGRPAAAAAAVDLATYDFREQLCDVGCPTLVVWGAEDFFVPVDSAHEYERLIDDCRKVIYDRTGHLPMIERPARFNADLRAFLEERAGEIRPAGAVTAA